MCYRDSRGDGAFFEKPMARDAVSARLRRLILARAPETRRRCFTYDLRQRSALAIGGTITLNDRGKLCPQCEQDIGLLAGSVSPLPVNIKCPHCGARLKYDVGSCSFVLVVFPSFLFVYGVSLLLAMYIAGDSVIVRFILSALLFVPMWWTVVQVPFTLYCRRCRALQLDEYQEP